MECEDHLLRVLKPSCAIIVKDRMRESVERRHVQSDPVIRCYRSASQSITITSNWISKISHTHIEGTGKPFLSAWSLNLWSSTFFFSSLTFHAGGTIFFLSTAGLKSSFSIPNAFKVLSSIRENSDGSERLNWKGSRKLTFNAHVRQSP